MSQYKTGTASVTNGSSAVTGSGTLWSANVSAGGSFTIASTGVVYDVASVNSNTSITLSVAYAGATASGAVYAIGTSFTVPDNFPEMSQGDIETATIFTRAMRKIQGRFNSDASDISGKADKATTYTETEVDGLLDDKADIAGQVFTGDIAAPKITASTGILFGTDTAAANTLYDYEEGTWTPVIGGGSCTNVVGKYTKVGNKVTVTLSVIAGVLTGATTNKITGLPFTNGNTRSTTSNSAFFNLYSNDNPVGIVLQGTTEILFVYNLANDTWNQPAFINTTNVYLHFSATYFTN